MPRMVARNSTDSALLTTDDLANGKAVESLLNARILEKIRDTAMQPPPQQPKIQGPYSFLATPLHLYLTLSNLPGIPYTVRGNSRTDLYRMVNHGDRIHVRIQDLGTDMRVASDWAGTDQITASCDLVSLHAAPQKWRILGDAALATAAFPIGLAARALKATRDFYKGVWFPAPEFGTTAIEPNWPVWVPVPLDTFSFVNVDGGMINNDPFDFARYALMEDWRTPGAFNPSKPEQADRAVIMIAPFPEGEQIAAGGYDNDTALLRVIMRLLPTLTQQVRFKVNELAAAADPNYASRWLIAPRRRNSVEEEPSSDNIACGLLSGFGGFLDQQFREHDFLLGQRNCQNFLRNWRQSKFSTPSDPWVVRLCGRALTEIPAPTWPRMSADALKELSRHIRLRAEKLVPALVAQEVGSRLLRGLIGIGWWWAKDKVLATIDGMVFADLLRRDQIEDGMTSLSKDRLREFTREEREVFAALATTDYDGRTETGIVAHVKLDLTQVQGILQRAMALPPGAVHRVVRFGYNGENGAPAYTLASRELTGWQTFTAAIPGLSRLWGVTIG